MTGDRLRYLSEFPVTEPVKVNNDLFALAGWLMTVYTSLFCLRLLLHATNTKALHHADYMRQQNEHAHRQTDHMPVGYRSMSVTTCTSNLGMCQRDAKYQHFARGGDALSSLIQDHNDMKSARYLLCSMSRPMQSCFECSLSHAPKTLQCSLSPTYDNMATRQPATVSTVK